MKIFILKKSISDLKNPVIRSEYTTFAQTVGEFIGEMVQKNYAIKPVDMPLDECITLALDEFTDGSYYIINVSRDTKYTSVDAPLDVRDGDEIMLIKLKYVRGVIWF